MKKSLALSLTCWLAALADLSSGAEARPVVFVSIPPQAWLVKRVAGEDVEVQTLLGAGANPHTYEPTSRQVKKLGEASLFLTVGLPFEQPLVARASRLNAALRVVAADAGIAKRGAHEHGHDHAEAGHVCAAGGDPHIWLSPRLMCAMASNTAAALSQALPLQRPQTQRNLEACVAEIQATDEAVRAETRDLPVRTWVVYHPSWGYFAEAYGLALLVIEQDGKAPSAKHLADVIRQAKGAAVKTVFTEPQYDRRPAEALAQQVGASLSVIDPLSEDWPALMRDVAAKLAGASGLK